MEFKPYKSPLGFYFTAEDMAMMHRAKMRAVEFFKTYGKGREPVTNPGIVREGAAYRLAYQDNPVGSLSVMEQKADAAEEVTGDYMCISQMARELSVNIGHLQRIIHREGITPTKVKVNGRLQNVFRLSVIRKFVKSNTPLFTAEGCLGELSPTDMQSGYWMRPSEIAWRCGMPNPYIFSTYLNKRKAPFRIYCPLGTPHKYYDIRVVMELDYIKKLIKKYNR